MIFALLLMSKLELALLFVMLAAPLAITCAPVFTVTPAPVIVVAAPDVSIAAAPMLRLFVLAVTPVSLNDNAA